MLIDWYKGGNITHYCSSLSLVSCNCHPVGLSCPKHGSHHQVSWIHYWSIVIIISASVVSWIFNGIILREYIYLSPSIIIDKKLCGFFSDLLFQLVLWLARYIMGLFSYVGISLYLSNSSPTLSSCQTCSMFLHCQVTFFVMNMNITSPFILSLQKILLTNIIYIYNSWYSYD